VKVWFEWVNIIVLDHTNNHRTAALAESVILFTRWLYLAVAEISIIAQSFGVKTHHG